ncbi:hypothetical protein [Mesorhizobium sp. Root552]|uniref:DUF7940 domain-containing protein n=1 Tax=Mesorhizobium sp. Root552 TaxID=1736555 RepID=UPI000A985454|nr:hypothetical protein [Mesorhizobium sp. Root552]
MLVRNWRAVLRYAWTVRLAIVIALLNALAITVSIITGALVMPPIWLAVLNGVLGFAVAMARLVDQALGGRDDAE